MSYQEFRPGRFNQIPPVVKNVLIINVILFIAKSIPQFAGKFPLDRYLDLYFYKSHFFLPHQFISYMFMHNDFSHLFFNMFAVYMFGSILENIWGSKRFLNYYILTGLGAALAQYIVYYFNYREYLQMYSTDDIRYIFDASPTMGASGAVFGLLVAFAMMFPNTYLNVYFVIPIKAKYFMLIYGLAELVFGVAARPGDNVAHFAHLGGAVVGAIIILIWRRNRNFFY